jgi:release factor glutamine methyltransferase
VTGTIKALLRWATQYLQEAGIETDRLDSEVLLAHALGTDRLHLYLHYDKSLLPSEVEAFRMLLHRRIAHEPVAYITGTKEFWSLDFVVAPGTLIPRPETEIVVEQTILCLQEQRGNHTPRWGLDIGTGSGNIAISVVKEVKECRMIAVDRSPEALQIARQNVLLHDVTSQVHLVQGDLFSPFCTQHPLFDIIVSNPPYVTTTAWETLSADIKAYEPRLALDGGDDGLDYLSRIIAQAGEYLRPEGYLVLEFGEGQAPALLALCQKCGFWVRSLVKDYGGSARVLVAQQETMQ